jgi:hypothetical protein
VAKSKGQFLYARLLLDAVSEDPNTDVDALPADLTDFFALAMRRIKDTSTEAEFQLIWRSFRPLLWHSFLRRSIYSLGMCVCDVLVLPAMIPHLEAFTSTSEAFGDAME